MRDLVSKTKGTGSRERPSEVDFWDPHACTPACKRVSDPMWPPTPIPTLTMLMTSLCDILGGQVSHSLPDNSVQLVLLHRTCAGGREIILAPFIIF